MKVISYHHREGDDLQFLYIDGEFDQSKFPAEVKQIISGCKGYDCSETVKTDFGLKAENLFKQKGFLFAPKVTWKESEGNL